MVPSLWTKPIAACSHWLENPGDTLDRLWPPWAARWSWGPCANWRAGADQKESRRHGTEASSPKSIDLSFDVRTGVVALYIIPAPHSSPPPISSSSAFSSSLTPSHPLISSFECGRHPLLSLSSLQSCPPPLTCERNLHQANTETDKYRRLGGRASAADIASFLALLRHLQNLHWVARARPSTSTPLASRQT